MPQNKESCPRLVRRSKPAVDYMELAPQGDHNIAAKPLQLRELRKKSPVKRFKNIADPSRAKQAPGHPKKLKSLPFHSREQLAERTKLLQFERLLVCSPVLARVRQPLSRPV